MGSTGLQKDMQAVYTCRTHLPPSVRDFEHTVVSCASFIYFCFSKLTFLKRSLDRVSSDKVDVGHRDLGVRAWQTLAATR